jgi:hypothetical protein
MSNSIYNLQAGFKGVIRTEFPKQDNTLPFDGLIEPKALFSTRKLLSKYTGACMRCVNATTGEERDIGFVARDRLDYQTLIDWAKGTSNILVKTWYDQSGSGNNFSMNSGNINNAPFILRNSGFTYWADASTVCLDFANGKGLSANISGAVRHIAAIPFGKSENAVNYHRFLVNEPWYIGPRVGISAILDNRRGDVANISETSGYTNGVVRTLGADGFFNDYRTRQLVAIDGANNRSEFCMGSDSFGSSANSDGSMFQCFAALWGEGFTAADRVAYTARVMKFFGIT